MQQSTLISINSTAKDKVKQLRPIGELRNMTFCGINMLIMHR